MTTRRQFLAAPALAASARPRNVLVVMSDQESALLPGPVRLPNRERLGGARFTHAFCNTPQCSAARAALLTGMEPHRTGVLTNVDGSSLGKGLPASLPTVARRLQTAGYSTGYFGKWHLGGGDRLAPYGFAAQSIGGADEEVAREAAAWIRKQRGPWLAWVSFLNPHHIYQLPKPLKSYAPRRGVVPPASDLSNLQGKPSEQRQFVDEDQGRETRGFSPDDWVRYRSYYCELVEKVDQALGTVLGAVTDWDDLTAVYTSDHGDALGEHGLPFKGPFMYEEGIRIPLVVRAPGLRGVRGELVTQADLSGMLPDGAMPARRDAVFLEYYAKQKWMNPIRTIRTRQWKLNAYDRGNREMYDLAADPHEMRNLAGVARAAKVQRELEGRVDGWRAPLTRA